ncbi:DUF2779 domain-containing protein [Salinispira pacifica]|uniref:DUF2779 domain-containing protein n=1 Tax=Salinispira pacifica TaxID=1307761 RepID=V5WJ61_9SPIO|nr:DUF2779 domain-containing protein [Salinispira pacifica]AHC15823.1 hypothetical protein L21SP2_2470 [Salinispira pacifica]
MSSDTYPGIRCIDDLFTGWRCPRQLAERLTRRAEEFPGSYWLQASPGTYIEKPSGAGSTHQFLEKTRVLNEFRKILRERYPGIVEVYPGPYQDLLDATARESGGSGSGGSKQGHGIQELESATLELLSQWGASPHTEALHGTPDSPEFSESTEPGILNGVMISRGRILFLDLIQRGAYGGLSITLLKAASKVKDGYVREAAWLSQGLTAAGYQVDDVNVLYLNKDYPRNSSEIFSIQRQKKGHKFMKADIAAEVQRIEAALGSPPYRIESIPGCRSSSCPFCGSENPLPGPGDISRLHRSGGLASKLRAQGITRVKDLHLVKPPLKQKIKPYHWIQHQAELQGQEQVKTEALQNFLDGLKWPLYFLDFECYLEALPRWNGVGMWEHVPFLYSAYRMDNPGSRSESGFSPGSPEKVGSYLIEPGEDRRGELADALIRDLGSEGSILVYGIHFEKAVLRRLASLLDTRRKGLEQIIHRLVDLQKPFAEFSVYHPDQGGKISLKTVLPVLTRHGYEDDKVSSGSDAFIGYYYLMHPELPVPESWDPYARYVREDPRRFYREVESYCDTDTYGMAYLVNALINRLKKG